MEIWKDIKDYEEMYQVSNLGNIKSLKRKIKNNGTYGGLCTYNERTLRQFVDTCGYYFVNLCKDGIRKRIRVHRIVAQEFLKNPNHYNEINHIDGNKLNNNVLNLEYCTHQHNTKEAWRLGLIHPNFKLGKDHHNSKSIQQFNKDGVFIKEWDCARQAERELGIANQNISHCCNGKCKTAGGYIWRFTVKV